MRFYEVEFSETETHGSVHVVLEETQVEPVDADAAQGGVAVDLKCTA
jgi:hypothetical protein